MSDDASPPDPPDATAWPGDPQLWTPQAGPQAHFLRCPVFEVVYGGARGGGKTDAALGDFLHHARAYGPAAKGLLVRRTRVALEPTLERAKEIFAPAGARWEAGRSRFRFANGALLYLRPLARDADAERYQGHDYTRVYVEELTQFASPKPVDKLKATLRSAAGVPCGFRATCNPGGPGHGWVKARHVDAGAMRVIAGPEGGRVFIPARLSDNPALAARDPLYVERLRQVGSEALVRAWLEGDWSAVEGAFFDRWSGRNVVAPFAVPAGWTRMRSLDWGYATPFSVGWWAVAGEPTPALSHDGPLIIPRGAMVRYREWYGAGRRPGEGARLSAAEAAAGIVERERGETIELAVADPAIFANSGGPTVAETLNRAGLSFKRGDNTRLSQVGALSGWDQVRARILGDGETPMLFVFETCRDFVRTVPGLTHDPDKAEDLDTHGEDHIADETRYACLARIWTPPPLRPAEPEDRWSRMRRRTPDSWKTM